MTASEKLRLASELTRAARDIQRALGSASKGIRMLTAHVSGGPMCTQALLALRPVADAVSSVDSVLKVAGRLVDEAGHQHQVEQLQSKAARG